MSRGLVISDLHLFSPRSEAAELWGRIADDHPDAEILVLNGDIFDFRWSRLPDEESTIASAVEWLDRLLGQSRWDTERR